MDGYDPGKLAAVVFLFGVLFGLAIGYIFGVFAATEERKEDS